VLDQNGLTAVCHCVMFVSIKTIVGPDGFTAADLGKKLRSFCKDHLEKQKRRNMTSQALRAFPGKSQLKSSNMPGWALQSHGRVSLDLFS
jgi:hypothetical protein